MQKEGTGGGVRICVQGFQMWETVPLLVQYKKRSLSTKNRGGGKAGAGPVKKKKGTRKCEWWGLLAKLPKGRSVLKGMPIGSFMGLKRGVVIIDKKGEKEKRHL